jgi:hypothetical protein
MREQLFEIVTGGIHLFAGAHFALGLVQQPEVIERSGDVVIWQVETRAQRDSAPPFGYRAGPSRKSLFRATAASDW